MKGRQTSSIHTNTWTRNWAVRGSSPGSADRLRLPGNYMRAGRADGTMGPKSLRRGLLTHTHTPTHTHTHWADSSGAGSSPGGARFLVHAPCPSNACRISEIIECRNTKQSTAKGLRDCRSQTCTLSQHVYGTDAHVSNQNTIKKRTHTNAHPHPHTHKHTYTHAHTHIHKHTHKHTHTHTHTHTYTQARTHTALTHTHTQTQCLSNARRTPEITEQRNQTRSTAKGLRDRSSPTCTLSQNGYGTDAHVRQ